jgi:hypothetical protein
MLYIIHEFIVDSEESKVNSDKVKTTEYHLQPRPPNRLVKTPPKNQSYQTRSKKKRSKLETLGGSLFVGYLDRGFISFHRSATTVGDHEGKGYSKVTFFLGRILLKNFKL